MSKILNSELLIKGKIWNNDSLELVDFSNYDTEKTEIRVQSSGTLSRIDKTITFTKGKNVGKTPFELLSINRNESNGFFYINCGKPPKELIKVVDSNSMFMVYKGNKYKNLDNLFQKYYKLSQGDVFKLGRIYLKVLDINLEKENEENKFNTDINNINNSKSSIMRSSSFKSVMVKGQEIIHGVFTPTNKLNNSKTLRLIDSLNKNDNINIFAGKHKINFITKKENNPLSLKKMPTIHRNNSAKEDLLFLYKNKKIKNNKKKDKEKLVKLSIFNDKNVLTNEKENIKNNKNNKKNKKPKSCRICYGTEFSIENPLICPCICKGSMKYIHFQCLKNWLNSKIETDLSINSEIEEEVGITYCSKDLACELCKTKFPDYINHEGKIYNIAFYKPKFKQFIILESIRADKFKTKFIHILSFDNNKSQITLGRSNDCELSIPELSVSRFHCFIHKDQNQLYLEDNNSKFGTRVLLQNPNLLMIDNSPLRLQKERTYIKLTLLIPSNFFSCCNTNTFDSKLFSYQAQNQKYCDVASSFIIKEDNMDNSNEEENENEENELIYLKNKGEKGDFSSEKGDNSKKNKNIKKIKIKKNKDTSKEIVSKDDNKEHSLILPNILNGLSTTKNNNLNLINVNKYNEVIGENTYPINRENNSNLLLNRDIDINNKKNNNSLIDSYNNKSNLLKLNSKNNKDNNEENNNKKDKDSKSIKLIDEN